LGEFKCELIGVSGSGCQDILVHLTSLKRKIRIVVVTELLYLHGIVNTNYYP